MKKKADLNELINERTRKEKRMKNMMIIEETARKGKGLKKEAREERDDFCLGRAENGPIFLHLLTHPPSQTITNQHLQSLQCSSGSYYQ